MTFFLLSSIFPVMYLTMCFVSARYEYRVKYAKARKKPAPQVYGGATSHETAHDIAMHDAVVMFGFWFFLLSARLIARIITGPAPRESAAEASARIERELAEEFGSRDQALGTIVVDVSRHQESKSTSGIVQRPKATDPWLWEDRTMCSTCMAVMSFNLCLKDGMPVPPEMGNLMINPCRCGQNKILSLGKIWMSQEK